MKFHRFAELFPLIEGQQFDDLVASIKVNGLREPVWLYEGQILDGRNRWRACEAAGIECDTREYAGDDPLQFVLDLNLQRRHLNSSQVAFLALEIEAIEADLAKEREARGRPPEGTERIPDVNSGEARQKAAERVGSNAHYVTDAKRLQREAPELAGKVRSGELTIPAAKRQLAEDQRKDNLARPVAIALPAGIHRGDFRELADQIADDSVELVFTDPPYDGDSVQLYEDAARIAARILKPGGSFIAYSGQRYLPDVLAGCSKHLRYWWTIAGVHSGGNQILQKLGIRCGWKPLVWFVKGTRGDVQNVMLDTITGDREKDAHEWQQAQSEAEFCIEKLTSPHGLVVDFCLGGGTTAAACKRLRRPFIGFEVDAAALERAIARVA